MIVMVMFVYFSLIAIVGAGILLFFQKNFGILGLVISALISILLSLGYLYFHNNVRSPLAGYIETIVMMILGCLVVALNVIFVFWCVEWFLPKTISLRGTLGGLALVIVVIGVSIYAWRAAHAIEVKNLTIPIDNLKFPSKMIYMSDIHLAKKSDLPFLQEIVDKVNQVEADFVVINGDFIDGGGFDVGDFAMLDSVNKPILYTYGNHETYAGNDYVYSLLAPTKVQMLSGDQIEFAGWEILGLGDIAAFDNEKGKQILKNKLSQYQWETSLPKMLILHEPIGAEVAEAYGVNFQLAGHTHYGQLFPFTFFVKLVFPYIKGRYPLKTSSLFVSSGVGTRGPAMRLGSRSEILVFEFVKK